MIFKQHKRRKCLYRVVDVSYKQEEGGAKLKALRASALMSWHRRGDALRILGAGRGAQGTVQACSPSEGTGEKDHFKYQDFT